MNSIDNRIPKKQITFTGRLLDYKEFRQYSDTFIETGTALGDGVQRALDAGFERVFSCEQWLEYFEAAFKRFLENDKVRIFPGKSVEALPSMLMKAFDTCVIFLDAHPAGPNTAGHDEWLVDPNGEANQHNIITAELKIILAASPQHLIIIDDINGMADGCAEKYMMQMLQANPNYKFSFYDENLSGDHLYKDKILIAIP